VEINKIYNEDCLITMSRMSDNFVDLVVTSPPYDDLRTYGGCHSFFDFEKIAKELFRVTKQGGVVVWIVGDAVINRSETGTSFKQALYFKKIGFNLHDTMIYQKNNFSKPSSNRYHQIFEYMFVFSKGKPNTFNPIKDRKNVYEGHIGSWGKNVTRQKDGSMKESSKKIIVPYGQRYNIWLCKVGHEKKFVYKHPAVFPIQLAKDHIISWSNKGDVVYDPMMGSGTTVEAAILLNRKYIGSEISKEYYDIAKKRIYVNGGNTMPRRNKTGPPRDARGPRDGRGRGKGFHALKDEEGEGAMMGGKLGLRKNSKIKKKNKKKKK